MPDQANAAIDGPIEGSASAATSSGPASSAELETLAAPAGEQAKVGPDAGADLSSALDQSEASGSQSQPAASAPVRPTVRPETRSLTYAVDLVFCIDVTGSMTPIIDAVKANALRFYDDVQANLTRKGKHIDDLRVRIIAFRDFTAAPDTAIQESSFFTLPEEREIFSAFVDGLLAEGGGDAPESGLEAVALAINSPWTTRGDRRRQVIVVWTDQPAHPLNFAALPIEYASSVPKSFNALTDLWEDPQGPVGANSKRLILFAPDGPGWSDISASWENVVHHPSQAGGGLSEVDYGTIIDSIGNSV